ncbi:MAG: hypothetical protein HZC55_21290 [Verrucomicrobia bacterium]|jgi:hypothetical protein|nr:hypothetical protein [Verrucomicrobiota bacterium]
MRLPKMSIEQYALALRAEGQRIIDVGGSWWREVRPCFFRPVLPSLASSSAACKPPWRALAGGFQHVLDSESGANSRLQCLVFPEAESYRLDTLRSSRRCQVQGAEDRFAVRPIEGSEEFKRVAHPAYLDFYRRTNYSYLANRVKRERFEAWSDAVFRFEAARVVGAFQGSTLVAASIFRVVGETMVYSVFFATAEAMKEHVSSLMLHRLRTMAAESGDIREIYVGLRKRGRIRTIDDFYLQRGCSLQSRPARLYLNPAVRICLKTVRPDLMRDLLGER